MSNTTLQIQPTTSSNTLVQTKRNINIDILKTACMLMVIILLEVNYGIQEAQIVPWTIPYWIVTCSRAFSFGAVNMFILISG